jgi:autotransporter-associated beta strand protein
MVISASPSSTSGSATITTDVGGTINFVGMSTGARARFIVNSGGVFDMSGLTTTGMTAGSIEGAGNFVLGSKELTTGLNNLSTEVSGIISGAGGSLVETGTGTLTLSGQNTYTGGTTIMEGTLNANSTMALGTGSVVVDGTSSVLNTQGTNITNAGTPNQSALTVLNGATVNVQGGSITATWQHDPPKVLANARGIGARKHDDERYGEIRRQRETRSACDQTWLASVRADTRHSL